MHRRSFIQMGTGALLSAQLQMKMPSISITGSDYWSEISSLYPASSSPVLNLNNGSAGMMPRPVFDAVVKGMQKMTEFAPYEMKGEWKEVEDSVHQDLAEMLGCSIDEVALTRNTTDGLNMVIDSLDLKEEEVVYISSVDYPFAINAWKNKFRHEPDRIIWIDYDPLADHDEIVSSIKAQIGRPGYLHMSYVTFREGSILPVKRVCELAHQNGLKVVLDAAHAFAHFRHDVKELGCDFYSTSMHKWLSAPHGCGLLYVKCEYIDALKGRQNVFSDEDLGILKFEHPGTHNFERIQGIRAAIDFQKEIGQERKTERLVELTDYWSDAISGDARYATPKPEKYAALGLLEMREVNAYKVFKHLEANHIHVKKATVAGKSPCFRITPNLFTLEKDLDRFVDCLRGI